MEEYTRELYYNHRFIDKWTNTAAAENEGIIRSIKNNNRQSDTVIPGIIFKY